MYVLVNNQVVEKYPYSISNLRNDNPQVSFPANLSLRVLAMYNVFPVVNVSANYDPETQYAAPNGCVYNEQEQRWETGWTITNKTQEELDNQAASQQQALIDSFISSAQNRLDSFAKERGYDDIKSACDYAGCSVTKFDIEGQYCKDKRAETWEKMYQILAEVEAQTRPAPTSFSDFESELPILTWPN